MDPPIINDTSFSAANPSSYTLTEIWPFPIHGDEPSLGGGLGLTIRDVSIAESTVTDQSGSLGGLKKPTDAISAEYESSRNDKRLKVSDFSGDNPGSSKVEVESSSGSGNKSAVKPPEPVKDDYIHVRARRGQATDSHSLAERARREKISERMKILQDLVPGCNKVIGKALVLDEIINYIQSLQHQVEFLSMKLEAVNSRMEPNIEGFQSKNLGAHTFDAVGLIFGSQGPGEYAQGSQPDWLQMQVCSSFERAT